MTDVFSVPGVDDLYALKPSDFTAARNALVKSLRVSGDRETAKSVGELRKPTRVAWAVNRAVREDSETVEDLLRVSDEVRQAQEELLGGGDAARLRKLADDRRRLVFAVVDEAVSIAGANYRDQIIGTVEAASTSDDARPLLRHGRLSAEVEAPIDFGFVGEPAADDATPPVARKPKADDLEVKRRQRDLERANQELERAEQRLRDAQDNLEKAKAQARDARQAANAARQTRDQAATDLADVQN